MINEIKFNKIDIKLYKAFKDISNKQFSIVYRYSSLLLYTLAAMQPIGNINKEYVDNDDRIKIEDGYIYIYDTVNSFYNIADNDVIKRSVAKVKLMDLLYKHGNDILNHAVEFKDDLAKIIEINGKIINSSNTSIKKKQI
mgnify:CR=1 FL=1